jgi:hypothetical protein
MPHMQLLNVVTLRIPLIRNHFPALQIGAEHVLWFGKPHSVPLFEPLNYVCDDGVPSCFPKHLHASAVPVTRWPTEPVSGHFCPK